MHHMNSAMNITPPKYFKCLHVCLNINRLLLWFFFGGGTHIIIILFKGLVNLFKWMSNVQCWLLSLE